MGTGKVLVLGALFCIFTTLFYLLYLSEPLPETSGSLIIGDHNSVNEDYVYSGEDYDFSKKSILPSPDLHEESLNRKVNNISLISSEHRFVVKTEEGEYIKDAALMLLRRPLGDPIDNKYSNSLGEVLMSNPEPGDEIRAEADGFISTRFTLGTEVWPDPFPVVLKRGAVFLLGNVSNDLGVPVEKAKVTVTIDDRVSQATTQWDGTFRLSAMDPPAFPIKAFFQVEHPAYCFLGHDVPVVIEDGKATLPLIVHRWAKLMVSTLNQNDKSVAGVKVSLAGPPEADNRRMLPGHTHQHVFLRVEEKEEITKEERDNQAGQSRINKVPPLIPLWAIIEHPKYGTVEKKLGTFEPDEDRHEIVYLTEPSEDPLFLFQVIDREGKPLADTIAKLAFGKKNEGKFTTKISLKVNEKGIFKVKPTTEEWTLLVYAHGYGGLKRKYRSSYMSGEMVTLIMEKSNEGIKILVTDDQGNPVSDVSVCLCEEKDKILQTGFKSDNEGLVEFLGLDPATTYSLDVGWGKPGSYFHGKDWKEVPSPAAYRGMGTSTERVVFKLVPPASIEGKIYKDQLYGKYAFLTLIDSMDHEPNRIFTISTLVGQDGSFYFNGLPPGRYHLWMEDVEGKDSFLKPMAIFYLDEGTAIKGAVVDW